MAQGMVTDFFATKKRTDPFQPSKRRKVQRSKNVEDVQTVIASLKCVDAGVVAKQNSTEFDFGQTVPCKIVEPHVLTNKSKCKGAQKANASTTQRRTSSRSKTTKHKSVKHGPLDKVLARAAEGKNGVTDGVTDSVNPHPSKSEDAKPAVSLSLRSSENTEEVTSVSDDHNATHIKSLPGTPTKRSQADSEEPIRRKRSKPAQAAVSNTCTNITTQFEEGFRTESKSEHLSKPRQKRGVKTSAKKSLDKTFQQYENKDQSSDSVAQEDGTKSVNKVSTEQAPTSKRTVQPRHKPSSTKTTSGKQQSKKAGNDQSESQLGRSVVKDLPNSLRASQDGSEKSEAPPPSGLGGRIRATLKNQNSPVKQEMSASSSNENKAKLTPSMVRERLCKSGKLAELQARLAKIKECADQAKMEANIATKPKKVVVKEQETKKSTTIPAYQKYHSLASPAPPSLTLPFKYKFLEQMFHSMDTVVSLLHNRKEVCTFPKLKDAVQEMCRRKFELHNVGQIKTVYPTGFFLSQQKQTIKQRATNNKEDSGPYMLTVQPNLDSDGTTTSAPHDSSEVDSQAMRGSITSLLKKFTPSMLIARRSIFHNSLVDVVKQHHKEFLSKLDRPLSVPDEKLTRWHPKFPLDTIPEVDPSPLPEPPAVQTYCNAKDVLDKARQMMTPRVVKALETVAKNSAMLKSVQPKSSSSSTCAKLLKPADGVKGQELSEGLGLKGVNQSLLERIRAKEAKNQVEAMMRDPEVEKRISRLERLPELCRILRVYFLAEKKGALLYAAIVKKLGDSSRYTLSRDEVEKHLDLMLEILPEWLTVHNIRKETYIKMKKTQDMNTIVDKVNKTWRESK